MGEVDAVDLTGCPILCARALSRPIQVSPPGLAFSPSARFWLSAQPSLRGDSAIHLFLSMKYLSKNVNRL